MVSPDRHGPSSDRPYGLGSWAGMHVPRKVVPRSPYRVASGPGVACGPGRVCGRVHVILTDSLVRWLGRIWPPKGGGTVRGIPSYRSADAEAVGGYYGRKQVRERSQREISCGGRNGLHRQDAKDAKNDAHQVNGNIKS